MADFIGSDQDPQNHKCPAVFPDPLTGDCEPGRTGPRTPSFAELLAATKRSAVHLEMRETYGPDDPELL